MPRCLLLLFCCAVALFGAVDSISNHRREQSSHASLDESPTIAAASRFVHQIDTAKSSSRVFEEYTSNDCVEFDFDACTPEFKRTYSAFRSGGRLVGKVNGQTNARGAANPQWSLKVPGIKSAALVYATSAQLKKVNCPPEDKGNDSVEAPEANNRALEEQVFAPKKGDLLEVTKTFDLESLAYVTQANHKITYKMMKGSSFKVPQDGSVAGTFSLAVPYEASKGEVFNYDYDADKSELFTNLAVQDYEDKLKKTKVAIAGFAPKKGDLLEVKQDFNLPSKRYRRDGELIIHEMITGDLLGVPEDGKTDASFFVAVPFNRRYNSDKAFKEGKDGEVFKNLWVKDYQDKFKVTSEEDVCKAMEKAWADDTAEGKGEIDYNTFFGDNSAHRVELLNCLKVTDGGKEEGAWDFAVARGKKAAEKNCKGVGSELTDDKARRNAVAQCIVDEVWTKEELAELPGFTGTKEQQIMIQILPLIEWQRLKMDDSKDALESNQLARECIATKNDKTKAYQKWIAQVTPKDDDRYDPKNAEDKATYDGLLWRHDVSARVNGLLGAAINSRTFEGRKEGLTAVQQYFKDFEKLYDEGISEAGLASIYDTANKIVSKFQVVESDSMQALDNGAGVCMHWAASLSRLIKTMFQMKKECVGGAGKCDIDQGKAGYCTGICEEIKDLGDDVGTLEVNRPEGGNHRWVRIKINGRCTHVDSYWASQPWLPERPLISHEYIFKTNDQIKSSSPGNLGHHLKAGWENCGSPDDKVKNHR